MNEKNRKIIWSKIIVTGEILQIKLKPSRFHPKGRNAYAHISFCIKKKFGDSYKDIPDDQFDNVMNFIEYLLNNPD